MELKKSKLISLVQKKIPKERILSKEVDLISYSYDASFYFLKPQLVVRPLNLDEVQFLLEIANEEKIPLTFRAAGTSLSGQAVGEGIIVDLSFGWKNYEILHNGESIRFEPGIIGNHLNVFLKPYKRKIGPDPASINACMMGGILANNASGMCCGVEFNSYHTLKNIKVLLANGYVLDTFDPDCEEKLQKYQPEIYQGILKIKRKIENHPELKQKIQTKFQIKNTTGYSLNAFVDFERATDILAHLMIGSEGTLGFIAEAELRTIPDPTFKYTGLLCFEDIFQACESIPLLKKLNAVAIELMDRSSIRSVENSPYVPEYLKELPETSTVLLVEFEFENPKDLEEFQKDFPQKIQNLKLVIPSDFSSDEEKRNILWNIRKGLFPSVGAVRKKGTTVIIEDVAFPLEKLPYATLDLQALFKKHGYENAIIFGHAKDGNLHFVITQKFETKEEIRQYDEFLKDVVSLVVDKYQGSLKAEHGTGRNIAPFVEKEWGRELYEIMHEIKTLLDPNGILNPGVILNPNPNAHIENLKQIPKFVEENVVANDFWKIQNELSEKCIECGFCESVCPSKNLTTTPRKRIILYRETIRNPKFLDAHLHDFEHYFFETCVKCGLCETPCPVKINTGNLVKSIKDKEHGLLSNQIAKKSVKFFYFIEKFIRLQLSLVFFLKKIFSFFVSYFESLTYRLNQILKTPVYYRELPPPSKWKKLIKNSLKTSKSTKPDFYYFPTCLSRVFGTHNGYDLVELVPKIAEKLSLRVEVLPTQGLCCSQPYESKGFLDAQKEMIQKTRNFLERVDPKIPIIVENTSCSYVFKIKREYKDFQFLDSIEWIEILQKQFPHRFRKVYQTLYVQNICSVQKLNATKKLISILTPIAQKVEVSSFSECCGFAGDKGIYTPDVMKSSTQQIKERLETKQYDGYVSSNLTCELGLTIGTKKNFKHHLYYIFMSLL
ncbi:MAG: FAD-binding oxidoreductase [Leptospiraceae bacterium]|nr:FAD-binding oxidoreductase [Leptospiraceae bacterium]MDW7975142.1 FAD-binding and (Fe-S)-binding domain-containing protein [Leptospiraceae bacterium]